MTFLPEKRIVSPQPAKLKQCFTDQRVIAKAGIVAWSFDGDVAGGSEDGLEPGDEPF
jgi:hypothetical protein